MKIREISLANFRNIGCCSVQPDQRLNIFYGNNAQGKTNLLEAIWLFSGNKSFRGGRDAEFLPFDQKSNASMKICYEAGERRQEAEIHLQEGKKKVLLNGVPLESAAKLNGQLPMVVFSPEHLSAIKEGPELRRKMIDQTLCQIKPRYAALLTEYYKILSQRNALLKDAGKIHTLQDFLEVWDEKLAETGSAVVCYREAYICNLVPFAQRHYFGFSEGVEELSFFYRSCVPVTKQTVQAEVKIKILEELKKTRKEDLLTGSTKTGPHREDLEICIRGKAARNFGSQGQQRSAVLALKMAEADILSIQYKEAPILLLDDVLSELDSVRQQYIIGHLEAFQVFITCCTKFNRNEGKIFMIQKGCIQEQKTKNGKE